MLILSVYYFVKIRREETFGNNWSSLSVTVKRIEKLNKNKIYEEKGKKMITSIPLDPGRAPKFVTSKPTKFHYFVVEL